MIGAKKEDFKTKKLPNKVSVFSLDKKINFVEYEQMKLGLIPNSMDDKWFIYIEEDNIFFHRSWTGTCVYKTSIQKNTGGVLLTKTLVNRDRKQYKFKSDEEDKTILNYLIDRLLFCKEVSFLIEDLRISGYDDNAIKHNMVGYARANNEE